MTSQNPLQAGPELQMSMDDYPDTNHATCYNRSPVTLVLYCLTAMLADVHTQPLHSALQDKLAAHERQQGAKCRLATCRMATRRYWMSTFVYL